MWKACARGLKLSSYKFNERRRLFKWRWRLLWWLQPLNQNCLEPLSLDLWTLCLSEGQDKTPVSAVTCVRLSELTGLSSVNVTQHIPAILHREAGDLHTLKLLSGFKPPVFTSREYASVPGSFSQNSYFDWKCIPRKVTVACSINGFQFNFFLLLLLLGPLTTISKYLGKQAIWNKNVFYKFYTIYTCIYLFHTYLFKLNNSFLHVRNLLISLI